MKENSVRKDDINVGLKILDDFANLYGNTVRMTENDYKKIRFALDNILSDYKRVLKENKTLNKKIDLMENYMVDNGWEICFDNIYAELNNCNGMERDWCRGDELEKEDIHKYFNKKLLESE